MFVTWAAPGVAGHDCNPTWAVPGVARNPTWAVPGVARNPTWVLPGAPRQSNLGFAWCTPSIKPGLCLVDVTLWGDALVVIGRAAWQQG
jgi:hypothetical protein